METNNQSLQLNEQAAVERLLAYHIQPTSQRIQIAQVLLAKDQHLSADQVLTDTHAIGSQVSLATVYNTLRLFVTKGLINQVIVDPARVFYDSNNSQHHHIYNLDTGHLADINDGSIRLEKLPKLPEGTVAEGIDVVVKVRNHPNRKY